MRDYQAAPAALTETAMAETDRGFLGLTHNPFVQPDEGFYEQADRKAHLEQLRHLSQWSRRVLLVTGPEGVGKSSLYKQLSATLEPRCKAARIHGALVNANREVMMSVAQGFGIAAPTDANTQLLGDLISSHVEEQSAAERVCVVLVDDADRLEPKAVVELMALAGRCSLQLVFFAEVRLVPAVERVAGRVGLGWHEIRLTGFSESQTREYLEWRFQQARYRGRLPFTDNQVREIQRLSEGLPGKINQMANVLLVKLETGEVGRADGRFPAVHKALLALLTVVVGLLYLLWQQNERVIDTLAKEEAQAAEQVASASATIEAAQQAAERAQELPLRTGTLERGNAHEVSEAAETRTDADPAAIAGSAAPEADAGAVIGAAASGQASRTSLPAADVSSELGPEAAVSVPPAVERSAGTVEAAVVPEETAPPDGEAPAVAGEEAAAPVQAAAPASAAEPVTETEAAAQADASQRDGNWLLAQPPERFTLQLVTVSSAERAAAFVAEQPDPSAFATYRLARDGRILHVVVYGQFSTRAEAEAASRRLPASVGRVQPWLRPMAQVHGAIRTTAQ